MVTTTVIYYYVYYVHTICFLRLKIHFLDSPVNSYDNEKKTAVFMYTIYKSTPTHFRDHPTGFNIKTLLIISSDNAFTCTLCILNKKTSNIIGSFISFISRELPVTYKKKKIKQHDFFFFFFVR